MRIILVGILFSCVLSAGTARGEPPAYDVKRATGRIVIDGVLDEADWRAAGSVGDFEFPWFEEGEKEQTEVKMLWDDDFLYLSYKCDDKWIWAEHYDTNSETYKDDCVEMFWDPNPADTTRRKYNMFEINCIGNLLSVYVGSGKSIHERVSRIMVPRIGRTIRGTVNDDGDIDEGWTIELAVRFSDYPELFDGSTPKDGDMWRVGLNRCGGKTNPQHSQWSPSRTEKPNFHRPEDFGRIYFRNTPVR